MLKAFFFYINAFNQTDMLICAQFCPLPVKPGRPDLVLCLFSSSSCCQLTWASSEPAFPWDYQEARHPFQGIWDAICWWRWPAPSAELYQQTAWYPAQQSCVCWPATAGDANLSVSGRIRVLLLKRGSVLKQQRQQTQLQKFAGSRVWSVLPEMRSRIGNWNLPHISLAVPTFMKATAIVFYACLWHWIAVTTNHWFYWGNFWKTENMQDSSVSVLPQYCKDWTG